MYIFEYKVLVKNLVISDLKTKYSNSVLGVCLVHAEPTIDDVHTLSGLLPMRPSL